MSDMIDRISAALRTLPVRDMILPGGELDQLRSREAARAVLEAIRASTADTLEAMSAGFSKEPSRDDPMPHYLQRQKNALEAMIDIALGHPRSP